MLVFDIAAGNQAGQIAVAVIVLAQQDQTARLVGLLWIFQPDIHPDNRLDPGRQRRRVKLHHRKQIALVGQRHRRHTGSGHRLHQGLDPHQPIGQRIFGMQMEMDEGCGHGVASYPERGRRTRLDSPMSLSRHHKGEKNRPAAGFVYGVAAGTRSLDKWNDEAGKY